MTKYIHSMHCSTLNGGDCRCLKDRGYTTQRTIPVGSLVTLYDGFKANYPRSAGGTRVQMTSGDVGTVVSYSNNGFNGIYAQLRLANGTYVNLQAGKITRVDDGGKSHHDMVMAEYARRRDLARKSVREMVAWATEHGIEVEM